jgi:hypothetical protein
VNARNIIIGVVVAGALVLAVHEWATREHWPHQQEHAQAVGSLRRIHTAQTQYKTRYGTLSPSLRALGPPAGGAEPSAEAANLLESDLAAGEKAGYVFFYSPTAPDEKGIASYTLLARPREFGQTGSRHFFTDQSGVIYSTLEDRPATAADQRISD